MKKLDLHSFIKNKHPKVYGEWQKDRSECGITIGNFCDLFYKDLLQEFYFETIKGRIVSYSHIVKGGYDLPAPHWELYKGKANPYNRSIYRVGWTGRGICLGWSRLHIGVGDRGGPEHGDYGTILGYEPSSFWSQEQVMVYVVEDITLEDNRYYKPYYR